jgi:predicted transcriptional regulator
MTPEREKEILEIEARKAIYDTVKNSSGCHFREIERRSGLSTGSVKYHLDYLTRNGLITIQKDGGNIRYFPISFNTGNKRLLGLLRQNSIRKVLLFMLSNHDINHEQIVDHVKLSPSTVSWHLKKLEEGGIIKSARKGRKTFYGLAIDRKEIMNLLITYKESFFDSMVDNAIEMWEPDIF